jgi:hypothetical protein
MPSLAHEGETFEENIWSSNFLFNFWAKSNNNINNKKIKNK